MPRRKEVKKRELKPDPIYGDVLVTKLINYLMRRGKKSLAERLCYGSFDLIRERTKKDPIRVFKEALDNVKPVLEVKSRRIGGATYQIPVEIRPERRVALALRWIVQSSKNRSERGFARKLSAELIDASEGRGASVKKKEDTHKMAEANRAFAHYRW